MEILTSTDPKLFRLSKHNRLVNRHKVEKLAVAMKKNNLLPYYPIIVNSKMEILDGQHRLEAAKLSDSVIYYIISDEGYDILNVAETNALCTKWKLQDFIKYYASIGYEDYEKLYQYINKWELPFITILRLLTGMHKEPGRLIRDGFFKITDEETALKTYRLAANLQMYVKFWKHREFVSALYIATKAKNFSAEVLTNQIMNNQDTLVKYADVQEYLKMIEKIYNKGTKNKISL